MKSEVNERKIAYEEALLNARLAFNETLRDGSNEDDAENVFEETLADQLS